MKKIIFSLISTLSLFGVAYAGILQDSGGGGGGGGGEVSVGSPVSGGSDNSNLIVDDSGNLATTIPMNSTSTWASDDNLNDDNNFTGHINIKTGVAPNIFGGSGGPGNISLNSGGTIYFKAKGDHIGEGRYDGFILSPVYQATHSAFLNVTGSRNGDDILSVSTDTVGALPNFVVTAAGVVVVGKGSTGIQKHISATASLDFGATAAGACDALTIAVTGAADGDTVYLGIPTALAESSSYQTFWGYVSSADTVTVKRCNPINATTALSNPAAATVRADVWKH